MAENPLISVITPSYNQGQYIRQTIESVLGQNYPNFEHIVMDGGSKDETVSVLKSYSHLNWTSEKDKGQSDALNKAFSKAKGEIIAWINSDDYYLPDTFHTVAAALRNYPVVMGKSLLTKISGEIEGEIPHVERTASDILKYWCYYSRPPQPAIFFTRSILESVRRPDGSYVDNNFNVCMDFDLWMRFWDRAPATLIDHRVCVYRMTETNKTGGGKAPGQHEELAVFNRYSGLEARPVTVSIVHSDDHLPALSPIQRRLEELGYAVEFIKNPEGSVHHRWHDAQSIARGAFVVFLEEQAPNYAELAACIQILMNSPWVGSLLLHSSTTEFKPLNFSAMPSTPVSGASYVMRRYALDDIGGIRTDGRTEYSLRELLCRMSAKGWGVIAAPSTRTVSPRNEVDSLFAPYSMARITHELSHEQEQEPFARIRLEHGFSPRIPNDVLSQCRTILSKIPSDLHRLDPNDEGKLIHLATRYPEFPLLWGLLARVHERRGRTLDAIAAREKQRGLEVLYGESASLSPPPAFSSKS